MFKWKKRVYPLLLSACLLLSGCQGAGNGLAVSETAYENQQADFDTFTENIFVDSVSADTLTLHYTLRHPED